MFVFAALLALTACASAPPSFCSAAKPIIAKAGDGYAIDAVARITAEIGDGCQAEAGCQDTLAAIRSLTGDTDQTLSQIADHNETGAIRCGWDANLPQ